MGRSAANPTELLATMFPNPDELSLFNSGREYPREQFHTIDIGRTAAQLIHSLLKRCIFVVLQLLQLAPP